MGKVVEKEVIIENRIEKPVVVEKVVETELDVELSASVEVYTREYQALLQRKADLEELLRSLEVRFSEFGQRTDYFVEISKLRKSITMLEIEMSSLRKTKVATTNKS